MDFTKREANQLLAVKGQISSVLKQHVGVGSITSDTEETWNKIQEVEIDDPG